jgi:colicin import membrane protein
MSALADALPFRRQEPAIGPAMGLSVVMHVVLIAILFFGVRFQSSPPAAHMVELWDPPPPPPPAPVVEVKPPPPPPPVVKPQPEPEVKKPDIALVEKPKPKPKPEVKKPEPKPAPKRDLAFEKMLKEQAIAEQKALDEQRRKADEARKERELKDLIARQQASARDNAIRAWQDDIMRSVRSRIIFNADSISGNPEAHFDVVILPTGDLVTVRKIRSSGNPAYDEAVERAIRAAEPLPLPKDRTLFRRDLRLIFRPKDR